MDQADRQEVSIYASPWVPGWKASYYRGVIESDEIVPWVEGEGAADELVLAMYDKLAKAALALGCNAIVGFEIAIDPFGNTGGVPSMRVELSGTAVQLQPVVSAETRKQANADRVARLPLASEREEIEQERKRRVAAARLAAGRS